MLVLVWVHAFFSVFNVLKCLSLLLAFGWMFMAFGFWVGFLWWGGGCSGFAVCFHVGCLFGWGFCLDSFFGW